jgi:hypothetical protein
MRAKGLAPDRLAGRRRRRCFQHRATIAPNLGGCTSTSLALLQMRYVMQCCADEAKTSGGKCI